MENKLRFLKEEAEKWRKRPEFVWHFLLESSATLGGSKGADDLIWNAANYNKITFKALSKYSPRKRLDELEKTLRAAKVRWPQQKADYLNRNFEKIKEMGGVKEADRRAFNQEGRRKKIAFMKQFAGIGDKYARNIWMSTYDPDFREAIAIDERIKGITEATGYSFSTYAEHERFYQEIAREAHLQGWELDRLLYNYKDDFLAVIKDEAQEEPPNIRDGSVWSEKGPRDVAGGYRFSTSDLMALSGMSRALEVLNETLDGEVRAELESCAGTKIMRESGDFTLKRQLQGGSYFIYAMMIPKWVLGCYAGYEMGYPDGYPRAWVGFWTNQEGDAREASVAAMGRMVLHEGWEGYDLDDPTEEAGIQRGVSLDNLLQGEDHVAAVKGFFIESIRQLREELTAFKREHGIGAALGRRRGSSTE
jgi:thermostable 8-oxoguanine DNA glycosylase